MRPSFKDAIKLFVMTEGMKMITILLAGALVAVLTLTASAQSLNESTLSWKVTRLDDTASKESMDYTAEFTTYHNRSKITWDQQYGRKVSDFKVLSIRGNWTDISEPGKIEFDVQYEGREGVLWIAREDDKLQIGLQFTVDSRNAMPYVFQVASVTKK